MTNLTTENDNVPSEIIFPPLEKNKKTNTITYSGPIPEASQLAQYENILPGLADRIVKITENKSNHKNEMEQIWLKKSFQQQTLGKIFGLVAVIAGMGLGAYVILHGHQIAGLVIGGTPLVSIAAIFVNTRDKE